MFNFYVNFAGQDMVTDAGIVSRAGANSKPHHYKHNLQKTMDLPKTWGFNGEKISDEKRTEIIFSTFQKSQWNRRPLITIIK